MQSPPNANTGLAEIRTWLETDAKDNIHVEIENAKVSGDTVKDGKITVFTYTLDDETLAKLATL